MKKLFTILAMFIATAFTYGQAQVQLSNFIAGFNRPVDIVNAGDARLFVVEQQGRIILIDENGVKQSTPFLDIRSKVNLGQNEQGMLGLVFHPDYANNGYFYVNYISGSGDGVSTISRFSVSAADPNIADPNSEENVLTLSQPEWNHNGGDLEFGPDGYMYIGFGDGGSGGDPWGNGQNPQVLLGKMLRIDVDTLPYRIPADNPFVDDSDVLDEIWAIGVRNPWRFTFDALTGDLWIGDVGQNSQEEIDFQPASSTGGENYGWDCREGLLNFSQSSNLCIPNLDLTEPVAAYKVSNFCNSVTGGYVYRGCKYPEMYGRYLYADYCQGIIWSILPDGQGGWTNEEVFDNGSYDISSFGVGADGELYAARLQAGIIYRVTMGGELTSPAIEENGGNVISVPAGLGTYQWYLNGNPINGATSDTLEVMENGDYTIEITYANGCTTLSDPLNVMLVGTDNLLTLHSFQIHPNPFNTNVQINIELTQAGKMHFEIFNLSGQKVGTYDAGSDGRYKDQLELGHLPSGVYLLKLHTEEGAVVKRLIKN